MGDTKVNVILAPGPLHLFWTTGVYYLWELSKKYRVILVVDKIYKKDPEFKKVADLADVGEILFIPHGGILIKHVCYAIEFKKLIKKYQPRIIFHHDPIYSSMMYLYYWGRKISPPALRVSYLNATFLSGNFNEMRDAVVDYAVAMITNKYSLPKEFCGLLFKIRGWFLFLFDYYILPFLFIREFLHPPMNPFTYNKLRDYWNDQFDFYLLYKSSDRETVNRVFGSEDGIRKIQHPLKTIGDEFHKVLYDLKEGNILLILPSYGFINKYQKENKKSNDDVINIISARWIEAIGIMKIKFSNHIFYWKLHPIQSRDFLWQEITNNVKREFPDVILLSPDENAQMWILKSKVVIGEVSTVLWWSSFFTKKITISFDIFGISSMDFFRNYEGVYYFNNLKSFSEEDFNSRRISSPETLEPSSTLSDFIDDILNDRRDHADKCLS